MTVIQWFEKAKSDGHDWADSAIRQSVNRERVVGTMRAAIINGLIWDETVEHQTDESYWPKIWSGNKQIKL